MTDREAFEDAWNASMYSGCGLETKQAARAMWIAALAYERAKQTEPVGEVVKDPFGPFLGVKFAYPGVCVPGQKLYAAPPADDCQYAKDVAMPEYRCAVKCQYADDEAVKLLKRAKRERVKALVPLLESIANRLQDEGGYVYTQAEGAPHLRINEAAALLREEYL